MTGASSVGLGRSPLGTGSLWLTCDHPVASMGDPERCQYGSKQAVFLVEAGPARHVAALYVDDTKIVGQSGALRHRLRILLYDTPVPTMISLERGGFSAWATLRPDNVTHRTLDLSLQKKASNLFASSVGDTDTLGAISAQRRD